MLTRCKRCIQAIDDCAAVLDELLTLEPDSLPATADWREIQQTLAAFAAQRWEERAAWLKELEARRDPAATQTL